MAHISFFRIFSGFFCETVFLCVALSVVEFDVCIRQDSKRSDCLCLPTSLKALFPSLLFLERFIYFYLYLYTIPVLRPSGTGYWIAFQKVVSHHVVVGN